ncbi:PAS domain-containing sensor histidine kinase [Roseixanthobacter glucoisosaccharinicivorans]|uniref:PAS domain-containing sensor histidine kinase n=1 Tax=Roseixanthobacter glucoisosaccharinicivorans TaxID=3119923 RepID=UPI00372A2F61
MDSDGGYDALILEEAPDAVIAIDADQRVLVWNRGAERLYGYAQREAIGGRLRELVLPSDAPNGAADPLNHLPARGPSTYEALRRRKDGVLMYVDVTAKRITHTNGTGDGAPLIVLGEKDVTQLRVQRDAKLLETRFRDLFELMPDAIVVLNATGRIVLINSQAEELFGYAMGSLIGEPVERLLPERLRAAHLRHRAGYVAQPRVRAMGVGLELHGRRADGSEFPVDISLSPLQTPEGTLVLSAIRDATERKRFEAALREKNEQLASAMQAKDRFLATMSHELRTPLNAVIGFTGTLLMRLPGPLNDDQERQLKTIQSSGRHLLSLINDLLDLARIEADKFELSMEPVVCQEVLRGVFGALLHQVEQKGLRFGLDMPEANLIARTDRRALTQILTNLCANAVKFCDHGSIHVGLGPALDGAADEVQFTVSDTGVGIRAEHMPTVFDAFARFESETGPREGSGLGLHISRRLAEHLGGRIKLESEYGKGSTFTLILPAGSVS